MQSKSIARFQEGKDYIILAIPAGENSFEVSAAIEEIDIPLYIAKKMSEIEKILSTNPGALGLVVAQKFLGNNAPKTFKKIRGIDPELPIVIMASDTNVAFEKTMRQMGIFYYLLSPFDREEFLNIVRALYSHNAKRDRTGRIVRSSRRMDKENAARRPKG